MVDLNSNTGLNSCTFNASYTIPDATDCEYPGDSCNDSDSGTVNDTLNSNCECVGATIVNGCTDETAFNYNASANVDDSSCVAIVNGCTDEGACNYDETANTDDASCTFPASSIVDCNGDCLNDADSDGTCDEEEVVGCMKLQWL